MVRGVGPAGEDERPTRLRQPPGHGREPLVGSEPVEHRRQFPTGVRPRNRHPGVPPPLEARPPLGMHDHSVEPRHRHREGVASVDERLERQVADPVEPQRVERYSPHPGRPSVGVECRPGPGLEAGSHDQIVLEHDDRADLRGHGPHPSEVADQTQRTVGDADLGRARPSGEPPGHSRDIGLVRATGVHGDDQTGPPVGSGPAQAVEQAGQGTGPVVGQHHDGEVAIRHRPPPPSCGRPTTRAHQSARTAHRWR